jgi:hypothetical protein
MRFCSELFPGLTAKVLVVTPSLTSTTQLTPPADATQDSLPETVVRVGYRRMRGHRERVEGNTVYQGIRYIAALAATPTSALAFSAVLITLEGMNSMSSFRTVTS